MKKRNGIERLVAAFLDSIFLSIIVGIVILIPAVIILLDQGFDTIFNYLINPSSTETMDILTYLATGIELVFGFIYFVVVPAKSNGQTFGKKILKLKVVNEEGVNPSMMKHFIRSIQMWGNYILLPIMLLMFVDDIVYAVVAGIASVLVFIITFISGIMLLAKEDERGIHDIFADTRVVRTDYNPDQEFVQEATRLSDWATVIDPDDEIDKLDEFSQKEEPKKEKEDDDFWG
jgi:uncharacterized RDD family membrane protein YckC